MERRLLPDPARVTVYDLTDWGRGLQAVNTALSLWAVQSPRLPFHADMGPDTLVLAMRAHARPLPDGSPDRTVVLQLTDSRLTGRASIIYLATLTSTGSNINKVALTENADAQVNSTTRAWKNLIIGGATLKDAADTMITGNHEAVQSLIEATKL